MLLRALWYNTYQTNVQRSDERMNRYEQRRRRVLDQLQFGEMMVLYSGESVACSMDEGFDFEANHHFFY